MKLIYAAALAAVLAGCASSGTQVSQQAAMQFKENVTTEAEIVRALGQPTGVMIENGKRTLSYTGMQMQVKGATFIPIVGMFAGGSDYQVTTASYVISPAGVLEKVTYAIQNGSTSMGSTTAAMPAQDPRSVK